MKTSMMFLITMLLMMSLPSWGTPTSLNYQGRIIKTDGAPLTYNSVSFNFKIVAPNGTCVIYQEQVNGIDMTNSKGIFDFAIGTGSVIYPTDGSLSVIEAFEPGKTFTCSGGATYSSLANDARYLRVSFHDGTGWNTLASDLTIRNVPFAAYSSRAERLGTYSATDFLLKAGLPTCPANTFLKYDGTNLTCSASGAGGTVTSVTASAPLTVTNGTTTPAFTITQSSSTSDGYLSSSDWQNFNGKQAAGSYVTALTGDVTAAGPGASAATVARLQGTILTLTAPASGQFIKHNGTGFVNATLAAGDVPNLDWSKIASGKPTTLSGYGITDSLIKNLGGVTGFSSGLDVNKPVAPVTGEVFIATDAQKIYQYNGTSWDLISSNGAAGGGTISSLTGDVTASGTGAVAATIANNAITSAKIVDATVLGTDLNFTGVNTANSSLVMKDSTGKFFEFACATSGHIATWTASGWACQAPAALSPAWSSITSTPTTLAGYGITDAQSSTLANGKILIGNASNAATALNMSGDATLANDGTLTLASAGTAGTYYKVTTDIKGRVTSGAASLVAGDIPSLDWSKLTSGLPSTLAGYGITDGIKNAGGTPSLQTGSDASKPAAGTAGRIYIATDTQKIYSDSGATWTVVGSNAGAGGTITALTGDVAASGNGSVSATIANSAVTNAKMANMAATTLKGNVTGSAAAPTDVTIASLQGTTASTFAAGNDSRITGALQSGATAGGDLSGTYPNPSVVKLQGTGVSSTTPTTAGQMLRFDGTVWKPNFVAMTDLRSSVTGTNQFASSCLSNQTLTYNSVGDIMSCQDISVSGSNFSSQTQNTFLAAPAGSNGAPTFRAIASADLPLTGATGAYVNGGNSFGATASIGTNDNYAVSFKTNNSARMTLDAAGNVGIGTTTPATGLHLRKDSTTISSSNYLTIANHGTNTTDNTNSYTIGGIMFDAYRDVRDPSNVAGMWAIRSPAASGLSSYGALAFGTGYNQGNIAVDGTGGLPTERMRIDSNGNVGIGTTTPDTKLVLDLGSTALSGDNSVLKAKVVGDFSAIGGGLETSQAQIGFTGVDAIGGDGTGAAMFFKHSTSDVSSVGWPSGGHFIFKGTVSAKDIVFMDGNLGIGRADPVTALDVNGIVRVGAGTCNVNKSGAIQYDSTTGVAQLCSGGSWINIGSGNPIPPSSDIVFKACPAGWTDLGATNSPAITVDGSAARTCRSPATPSVIPANTIMPLLNCPSGWTSLGAIFNGSWLPPSGGLVTLVGCQSPAYDVGLPSGTQVIAGSGVCPTNWAYLGNTSPGSKCTAVSCRICESPGGQLSQPRVLYAGAASSTGAGAALYVKGGGGGATSGNGGTVWLQGGYPVDGNGGAITISGTNGLTTTATARTGGNITISAGNGISGGAGGTMTLQAGNDSAGTYSKMTLQANGGLVGIGTSSPSDLLHLVSTTTNTALRLQNNTGGTGRIYTIASNTTGELDIYDQTAGTSRLRINSSGYVGLGVASPSYQLELSTDSAAKPGTSTWTIASDERLKDIRAPFTRGLAAINGLNTVYFNYKKDNPLRLPSKKEYVGIKAQDAKKVIPEAVSTDDKGYLHVTNDSIIWTAVNAIKELYQKLVSVDARVERLEAENAQLKAYLCTKDPTAPICN